MKHGEIVTMLDNMNINGKDLRTIFKEHNKWWNEEAVTRVEIINQLSKKLGKIVLSPD